MLLHRVGVFSASCCCLQVVAAGVVFFKMADGRYSIVPLSDNNFSTWKIQLKMVLIREDLWGFVTKHEDVPSDTGSAYKKYCSRRDRALSILVMAIEPRLLYLIGDDPEDPLQ